MRFVGHLITKDGLKPDPEKVKTVNEMPNPTDVAVVRRLLGFVNYLCKFMQRHLRTFTKLQLLQIIVVTYVMCMNKKIDVKSRYKILSGCIEHISFILLVFRDIWPNEWDIFLNIII